MFHIQTEILFLAICDEQIVMKHNQCERKLAFISCCCSSDNFVHSVSILFERHELEIVLQIFALQEKNRAEQFSDFDLEADWLRSVVYIGILY